MSEQKPGANAIGVTGAASTSIGATVPEAPGGDAFKEEGGLPVPSLAEEQAALHGVAALVADGAEPSVVFSAVAEAAGRLVKADIATIDRFDSDDTVTVLAVLGGASGAPSIGSRMPTAETGSTAAVRSTGRTARIDRYTERTSPTGYQSGFRAAVSVPIVVAGRPWGATTVVSARGGRPFPAGTEERLAHFSELIAIAIANAQAREELELVAKEQAALRRLATLVAKATPREQVYAAVTEEIGRRHNADVVALLAYEEDGTATVLAGWGVEGIDVPLGARMVLAGEGAAITVLQTHRPAYVSPLDGPPGSVAGWLRDLDMQVGIGAPVVVENELWGVAIAASRRPGALPAASETQIAEFTELVAAAIATAEARAALQDLANEQAALRRVATLVAEPAEPQAVFAAVAAEVGRLLSVESVVVSRYEADDTVAIVAGWGAITRTDVVGSRFSFGTGTMHGLLRETGRPVRIENFAEEANPTAMALGIRHIVGAPITVEGRLWGAISMPSLRTPAPAGTEDRLADFTELVATAIANAEAQEELAASRARLVASADDERRRIVRDLHDAAQQRLVHTIITLKLARRAQEAGDQLAAGRLVGEALDHAERANAELRGLVHGILPSILTRGGLAAAVAELTARLRIPVDVDITSDRLPTEIEANAYFVVAEALTNVAKHSRAQSVEVRAQVVDSTLRLEVRDDGVGGARPDGSGLRGVADRVVALGGTLRIDSPDQGGTRLCATLPLPD